jgi:hypothetical protein
MKEKEMNRHGNIRKLIESKGKNKGGQKRSKRR